jgi:hypothetical protein
MNKIPPQSPLAETELDRIMGTEDTLLPSSGFAAGLMQAIEQQAAQPQPIPFPWRLAIPGFAVIAVGLGSLIWLALATLRTWQQAAGQAAIPLRPLLDALLAWSIHSSAGPAVLALLGSCIGFLMARRMAAESSLL